MRQRKHYTKSLPADRLGEGLYIERHMCHFKTTQGPCCSSHCSVINSVQVLATELHLRPWHMPLTSSRASLKSQGQTSERTHWKGQSLTPVGPPLIPQANHPKTHFLRPWTVTKWVPCLPTGCPSPPHLTSLHPPLAPWYHFPTQTYTRLFFRPCLQGHQAKGSLKREATKGL